MLQKIRQCEIDASMKLHKGQEPLMVTCLDSKVEAVSIMLFVARHKKILTLEGCQASIITSIILATNEQNGIEVDQTPWPPKKYPSLTV